ncbi:MAG: hypothetical protein M1821_006237 [Bathelium mastoideum]|nr:MAG: hypothetical protein M1821_006237 [Bathelium mastoideum]KAI9686577.1 MAG: hypothetical protein M1822_003588 [Bathelium mastoideum]
MPTFNPLRVAKRQIKAYTPVLTQPEEDDWVDEEYTNGDDSDWNSAHSGSTLSSRETSASHEPMLREKSPYGVRPRGQSRAYQYRKYRRCSRRFACILGTVLIIFILTLTELSYNSARNVEQGIGTPPPPPPVWEQFPFLKRYHGGLRTLVPRSQNIPEYPTGAEDIPTIEPNQEEQPRLAKRQEVDAPTFEDLSPTHAPIPPSQKFDPYTDNQYDGYMDGHAVPKPCFIDSEGKQRVPPLRVYEGVPQGTPINVMGSYEIFGLRDDVCFERFGRLGPYGLGYSRKYGGSGASMAGDREGVDAVWAEDGEIDYRKINWKEAQDRCVKSNSHRFQSVSTEGGEVLRVRASKDSPSSSLDDRDLNKVDAPTQPSTASGTKRLPRTAVIIRTWQDFQYDEEDLMYLRALISELSIASSAEYEFHFLIHVKDNDLPIWSDKQEYERVLNESLPEEFRGMGTLWSERQMGLFYGGLPDTMYRNLPVHGVYRSTYMPMQHFAQEHPEYDFFWHWEMDIRYTGHFYHLFDKVSKWAREQPRKGLWERNSRFYVPSEHGSWEDFKQMVRVQTEHGTASSNNIWANKLPSTDPNNPNGPLPKAEVPIWGPEPPPNDEFDIGTDPHPKTIYDADKYEWGVGEDADLITFNPLFDPKGTNWILADDVTGYQTPIADIPRRTAIITAGRLSRRLLDAMHRETSAHRHTMFSEMWPGSCALHHGLKAVYAPHPVFIDRRWPTSYLAATFNGGRNGAAGGARTSVFSDERQHNFRGTTWYYDAGFAPNLWKRWLGYKVDNDGGEQYELSGEGRMCLPAMLLHPVKQVDLVIEKSEDEYVEEGTGADVMGPDA